MKASTVPYFRLTLLFFIYVGRFEDTRGFQVQATSQTWTPFRQATMLFYIESSASRFSGNGGKRINALHQIQTEAVSFQRTAALILLGNTAKTPAIYSLCFCRTAIGNWSHENEQLDEFASVMTNSSGGLIGGSCTGGMLSLVVVIYILYRLLRDYILPRIEPAKTERVVETVPQTNCQSCRARNLPPSSPPPAYEASCSFPPIEAWEVCTACMSTKGRMPCPTH